MHNTPSPRQAATPGQKVSAIVLRSLELLLGPTVPVVQTLADRPKRIVPATLRRL